MSAYWGVVGDVVASRSYEPGRLAGRLSEAFAEVATRVPDGLGPTVTVGDEFQALYEDRAAVSVATFWLRVALVGHAEVRMGIGYGEAVIDEDRFPLGQDGPVWWASRAALERVEASERSRGRLRRRLAVEAPDAGLFEGYLLLRDEVLSGIDATDAAIVRGLADGLAQGEIAARLGLHQSNVSRRIHEHGLAALLAAEGIGV